MTILRSVSNPKIRRELVQGIWWRQKEIDAGDCQEEISQEKKDDG